MGFDFDQMYDALLHNEFGSGGARARGAADPAPARDHVWDPPDGIEPPAAADEAPAPVDAPAAVDASVSAVRVVVEHTEPSAPVHRVFRANGRHAAEDVPAEGEGPRGLSRYRNAAMVGAGGLTCAAVGAFLGGLGGYFTIDPAAAHPFATSAPQNQPLAAAVDQAYRMASEGSGSADATNASFSSPSGALAQSVDPLGWLTTSGSDNVALAGSPGSPATLTSLLGLGEASSGLGSGLAGIGLDCTTQSDLGVGCIVTSLTGVLGSLGSTPGGAPTGSLAELLPSLNGVVSDVTGALSELGTLLPISSLPTAGLPTSVLDELGLGSISVLLPGAGAGSGLSSLGSLGSLGPSGAGTVPGATAGALDPVLSGILAAAGEATSSTSGSHPSSGGSSSSAASHPVTSALGSVTSPSVGASKTTTTSSSTTTTPQPTSGSGGSSGTTVTVPLPPLPLPSTPPVSVGGVSVGVNSTSSGSGLSLSLP